MAEPGVDVQTRGGLCSGELMLSVGVVNCGGDHRRVLLRSACFYVGRYLIFI